MGEQPKMMHFPMRAWRSLSQREGGAVSGMGFEVDERARRDVGFWLRGMARRARRARGSMVTRGVGKGEAHKKASRAFGSKLRKGVYV